MYISGCIVLSGSKESSSIFKDDGGVGKGEKTMRNRDHWTCKHCGANLDHGEKCDCQYEGVRRVVDSILEMAEKEFNKLTNNNIKEGEKR